MLEDAVSKVYTNTKLSFYRNIFSRFETREATLSAVETFCVEVIYAMGEPTINEFAKFVNISQANAAYKVQSLIEKGYVIKEQSQEDRREYRLLVTDRFHQYNRVTQIYIRQASARMKDRFSEEDLRRFEDMLTAFGDELMKVIV